MSKMYGKQLLAICRECVARLRYFEYWPTRLFYLPIYAKIIHWALRLRSLAFMTTVNPGIEFGGLLNYSKSRILAALPEDKILRSFLIFSTVSSESAVALMAEHGLQYPVIAKPDLGERGFAVRVVRSSDELDDYLQNFSARSSAGDGQAERDPDQRIILQEYFHPAQEFAVLYSIAPGEAARGEPGQIRSICAKQPLLVEGDGRSCLWQLIARHERAAKRFRLLRHKWRQCWYDILPAGERLQLTHIGAHSLGTDCISAQERSCPELLQIFARLSQSLNPEWQQGKWNFTFGRFDILAKDWQAVLNGEFKVIELNGVNAEPLHIYHPKLPLRRGWHELWRHWQRIGHLAEELYHLGYRPDKTFQLVAAIREHDRKIQSHQKRRRH